jgi:hypothetical protein
MKRAIVCGFAALLIGGVASPLWADDQADVAAAMDAWKDYLAKGSSENPGDILSLYAEDGVLWGTISSTDRRERLLDQRRERRPGLARREPQSHGPRHSVVHRQPERSLLSSVRGGTRRQLPG